MKKITEKQNLVIRLFLIKNGIKLKNLASHLNCYQSQLTGYLNGMPISDQRYEAIKQFCKL